MMAIETTADAYRAKLKAKRLRHSLDQRQHSSPGVALMDLHRATDMERQAAAVLDPQHETERGTGGELVPPPDRGLVGLEDAVKDPDAVSIEASIDRIALADKNGVFNLAFDAAEAAGADNPLEQMLVHQMAAAHKAALDLLASAAQHEYPEAQAKLANTAARLMSSYQKAMLTLYKTRRGGEQRVIVQHVQVEGGGQAIVTGSVDAGRRGEVTEL